MDIESKLLEAKRNLYAALLEKGAENWSAIETDICFHLSIDPQIQKFLSERLKPTSAASSAA